MRKILFVILGVVLILNVYASGCGRRTEIILAPIHDMYIWADNSSQERYFVDVVCGLPDTCHEFHSYDVATVSNRTIRIEVFNTHTIGGVCAEVYMDYDLTIEIGVASDFAVGETYTVEVNEVTETFTPPIS